MRVTLNSLPAAIQRLTRYPMRLLVRLLCRPRQGRRKRPKAAPPRKPDGPPERPVLTYEQFARVYGRDLADTCVHYPCRANCNHSRHRQAGGMAWRRLARSPWLWLGNGAN